MRCPPPQALRPIVVALCVCVLAFLFLRKPMIGVLVWSGVARQCCSVWRSFRAPGGCPAASVSRVRRWASTCRARGGCPAGLSVPVISVAHGVV